MKGRSQSTRRERLLEIVRAKSAMKHRSLSRMNEPASRNGDEAASSDQVQEKSSTPPSRSRREVERIDLSSLTTPRKNNTSSAIEKRTTPATVYSSDREQLTPPAKQPETGHLDTIRKQLNDDFVGNNEKTLKVAHYKPAMATSLDEEEEYPLDEQSVFSGTTSSSILSAASDVPFDEKVARMKLRMKARNVRNHRRLQESQVNPQQSLPQKDGSNGKGASPLNRAISDEHSLHTTSTSSTAPTKISPTEPSNSADGEKDLPASDESFDSSNIVPRVNRSTAADDTEMNGLIQNLDAALSNVVHSQAAAMVEDPIPRHEIDPNIQSKFSESMNREHRLEQSFESMQSEATNAESKAESYFTEDQSTEYSTDSEWTGQTSASGTVDSATSREIRRKKLKNDIGFSVLGSLFENDILRKNRDENEEKRVDQDCASDVELLLHSVRDRCCSLTQK